MAHFDVFNGDADGLCALHQLRLATPRKATLITGVKRDIALLGRVDAHAGDSVTVLDISADANQAMLLALLQRGAKVQYFDHHGTGILPDHPGLQAIIDTAPDVCTAIIVDRWLGGAYRLWAIVAAFGDNLAPAAKQLAQQLHMQAAQIHELQALGEALNYNAYGDSEADLIIPPAALYERLHPYADPFAFMAADSIFHTLRQACRRDLEAAKQIPFFINLPHGKIVLLPDAAWSRRVHGTYGNFLARRNADCAHAVLAPNLRGGYTVSVRAPLSRMRGADRLCRLFAEGGGRSAAAGINHLSRPQLQEFIDAFDRIFSDIARPGDVLLPAGRG